MKRFWWVGAAILIWIVWIISSGPAERSRPTQSVASPSVVVEQGPTVPQPSSVPAPSPTPAPSPVPTDDGSSERGASADTATYRFVSGDRVRIRSGPNTSSSIMGHLNRGDRVRYLRSSGDWSEVVSSLGRGWMSSQYLSVERPSVEPAPVPEQARRVAAPTNREIREARAAIIRQSIAGYPGSCPCPYNTDRAGRRCGGRSAWSRPGGYSPICYDSDVTESRLQSYFARRR